MTEPGFDEVLAAAAKLQLLVPDAVLVGGTAASIYAHHRVSFDDDDHVVADLRDRFEQVLAVLESSQGWVTARVSPGRVILDRFDGLETGVLQLRRRRALEVVGVDVAGQRIRVPTEQEMLRVKAWMIVYGNATRDFLDVSSWPIGSGSKPRGTVLAAMASYYADQREGGRGVTTQLVRMLADRQPYDFDAVDLASYRALAPRWRSWPAVVATCGTLATAILATAEGS